MTELLFKQRMFSWFDSYDIYDVNGETRFVVRGRPAWGHKLEIYDRNDRYLGKIQQEVLTFLPRFDLYVGAVCIGQIKKEFTLFRPSFVLDCNGWQVEGNLFEWDYTITDAYGAEVAYLSKELLHVTDTYVLDIPDPQNALLVLMIALAIDAAKCSNSNN